MQSAGLSRALARVSFFGRGSYSSVAALRLVWLHPWSSFALSAAFCKVFIRMDPWIYLGSAVLLGSVSLLACLVPCRRATRLDPMAVLRRE